MPDDLPKAFEAARRQQVGALTFGPDTQFLRTNLAKISELAVMDRLPIVADRDFYAEGGILMAYGPNLHDLWARAAYHVDKIFRGAKPADLPVEQPTKFELVINLADRLLSSTANGRRGSNCDRRRSSGARSDAMVAELATSRPSPACPNSSRRPTIGTSIHRNAAYGAEQIMIEGWANLWDAAVVHGGKYQVPEATA